jgi:hypothetical protein
MADVASGGHLGAGIEEVTTSSSAVGGEKLEHRVLCMSFRCICAAHSVFKRFKLLPPSLEGERTKGEHNIGGFATGRKFGDSGWR